MRAAKLLGVCLTAVFLLGANGCPDGKPACDEIDDAIEASAKGTAPLFKQAMFAASGEDTYIVNLRPVVGVAAVHRAAAISGAVQSWGAQNVEPLAALDQAIATMDKAAIERARDDNRVLFVERVTPKYVSPIEGEAVSSWGLDRVTTDRGDVDGLIDLGAGPLGAGVVIGVIDTLGPGEPFHPDYAARVIGGFSAFGPGDGHGHGTHVTGTAAGKIYGLASEASIWVSKVLDDAGRGSDATVLRGVNALTEACVANGWRCVANSSLGGPNSQSLRRGYCKSAAAGVFHAVAAGNDNQGACGATPADVEPAFTTAASNKSDGRAFFSNQGPCCDGFAPGVDITSTWRGGGERVLSGTSMAAPHVAGAAAVFWSRNTALDQAELKAFLIDRMTPDEIGGAQGVPNRLLWVG